MTPQPFHEANKVLTAPKGMEQVCGDLPVYSNGVVCISCYQPDEAERARIAAGAPIWLTLVSGETQPPVGLSVESPFILDGQPHG